MTEVGLGGALGLGAGRVARTIAQALGRSAPKGLGGGHGGDGDSDDGARPVVVLGEEVARALDRGGVPILLVQQGARPRRRGKGLPSVEASPAALPLEAGAARAAVIARLDGASLEEALGECARVVGEGGLVVVTSAASGILRKPPAPEAIAGALLHARLVDIEQLLAGSTLLTLGRVRRAAR